MACEPDAIRQNQIPKTGWRIHLEAWSEQLSEGNVADRKPHDKCALLSALCVFLCFTHTRSVAEVIRVESLVQWKSVRTLHFFFQDSSLCDYSEKNEKHINGRC